MPVDLTPVRKHMKELRQQRDQLQSELNKIERELQAQEHLNRLYAPLGYFLSHEKDKEIECEAIVLDTAGDNLLVEYWMPSPVGREQGGYLKWLQTPEERSQFSSTRRRNNPLHFTNYFLAIGKKDASKAESTQECHTTRLELAQREAIEVFEQRQDEDDLIVRLVDASTRTVEFTVDRQTINTIKFAPSE